MTPPRPGTVVIRHGVFYDRQPQPRAANGPGTTLIHPVKPLKDSALIPLRDADAGIPNQEGHVPIRFRHLYGDASAGDVVLHGVLAEVPGDLIQ